MFKLGFVSDDVLTLVAPQRVRTFRFTISKRLTQRGYIYGGVASTGAVKYLNEIG